MCIAFSRTQQTDSFFAREAAARVTAMNEVFAGSVSSALNRPRPCEDSKKHGTELADPVIGWYFSRIDISARAQSCTSCGMSSSRSA